MPVEITAKNTLPAWMRYAKAVLLTPTIGSLLLCLLGLVPGAAYLIGHRQPASHLTAAITPSVAAMTPAVLAHAPSTAPALKPAALHPFPIATPARLKKALFSGSINSDDLRFLNLTVSQSARDAVRRQDVRSLISKVIPYVPFHFGIDHPLTDTLMSILYESAVPVTLRDNRYLVMATLANHNNLIDHGRRRALFWVDLQTGTSVGAIFFYPANGEPTPTLTLFSRQVDNTTLAMTQMPAAFLADFDTWLANAGMPPITTRYFINARGNKMVLTHDEDLCAASAVAALKTAALNPVDSTVAAQANATCAERRRQAQDIDLQASYYLGQTHYASNATLRMAGQSE